jgi:hypothetical protein
VPRAILAKRGEPTDEEWAFLREHPAAGARLAAPLRDWLGEWGDAIEQHHERWDGRGYPRGLAGTEISLAARIVAVADVFDVITSSRTYKEPSTPSAARMEITRCAGSQFDPDVVRAFLAISVRRGRLAGALAWVANASVLARLPTQAASTLAGGAVAIGLGVSAGLPSQHGTREGPRPERARPTLASAATGSTIARAGVPARPAERPKRRVPVVKRTTPARAAPTPGPERAVRPEVETAPNDSAARLEPTPASPQPSTVQAHAETLGSYVPPRAGAVPPALPEPPRLPEPPAVPPLLPSLPELPAVPPLLPSESPSQPPALPPLPSLPQAEPLPPPPLPQAPPRPASLPSLAEAPPLPLVGG